MQKRSEIDPPEIEEFIEFQIVDWFVPEASSPNSSTEYDIEVYGVTQDGYTVRCKIEGFEPFFYVKCPPNKTKGQLQHIIDDLEFQFEQGNYRYHIRRDGRKIEREAIPSYLWGHYKSMKLIRKHDFWGFQDGKTSYFIRVSVSSLKLFRILRDVFSCMKDFSLYESNIEPFIRYIHKQNILPCGWVRVERDDISANLDDGTSHYRFCVSHRDLKPIERNSIAPLLVASFDIECTSSHGDFPLASKDYRKVAQQLIANSSRMNIRSEIRDCLVKITGGQDYEIDASSKIQSVFFKNPVSPNILQDKIDKAVNIIHKWGQDSFDEDELTMVLNSYLPKLNGDQIIQIGTTFHIFGSDEIVYKHIVTLKDCLDIDGVEVVSCNDEKALLMGWKEMIKETDPDILTGYNILGFDFKYIYDRTLELGIDEDFRQDLGRSNDRAVVFQNKTITSSALGEVITTFYDMEGVLIIDVFTFIKRDMNLESYKLDFVASHILKERKNDLKPSEIFSRFLGGPEDIRVIAEYCVQDCCLVNKIIHKRKILENNFGMANVCLVPVSYIFHRGQGIKIYSLVLNECAKRKQVIPTLQKDFMEDDEGYVGAIVLDPKVGIYIDDPIVVFDYSSLYPSSMIAENLSHDSYIIDQERYINPDGTLRSDNPNLSLNKIQLPDGGFHYFVKDSTTKYTIPQILQKLIKQRKVTRSKIEYERVVTRDGQSFVGLVKEKGEGVISVVDLEQDKAHTVNVSDVVERKEAFTDFEKAVFDSLQLAYKVTANSLYGQTGAKTSQIYMKPIAQSTTSTGRNMILMAKGFVEEKYNADVIYGDSVMPYTPILLKVGKQLMVTTFDRLDGEWSQYNNFKMFDTDRTDKEQVLLNNAYVWTHAGWAEVVRIIRHKTVKRIYRIATGSGVVDVTEDHSLIDHEMNVVKPGECYKGQKLLQSRPFMLVDMAHISSAEDLEEAYLKGVFMACGRSTGPDHWNIAHDSFEFVCNLKDAIQRFENIDMVMACNAQCHAFELYPVRMIDKAYLHNKYRVCYDGDDKVVPSSVLNGAFDVMKSFYKGLMSGSVSHNGKDIIEVDSQLTAESICILMQRSGYVSSVVCLNNRYRIGGTRFKCNRSNSIRSIEVLHEEYDGYVYDIETRQGVFKGGVGDIILKNTDSIFCKFELRDDNGNIVKGKEAIPHAIKLGQRIERHIAEELLYMYKPQALNYEKVLSPLILFSKKRYTGLLYETDPNKFHQKSMGIVLKRRDNAHIVKDVYGSVIDKILRDNDLEGSFKELDERLSRIVDGKVDVHSLVISKTLKSTYAAPEKIPHKALADRISARDPGNKPAINDRIPFVYIRNDDPYALQGDRVEHPDYIKEHPEIQPDYLFYITNQIMNPVVQLYTLCMESIPGYSCSEDYWKNLDKELKDANGLYVDDVKRANRIQNLKEQMVVKLLFSKYIESLGGIVKRKARKKEQREIEAELEEVTVQGEAEFVLKIKESRKDGTTTIDVSGEDGFKKKEVYQTREKTKEDILIAEIIKIADERAGQKITFKIEGYARFVSKWCDLMASTHEKNDRVYIYDVMKNAIVAIEYRALAKYMKRISIVKKT